VQFFPEGNWIDRRSELQKVILYRPSGEEIENPELGPLRRRILAPRGRFWKYTNQVWFFWTDGEASVRLGVTLKRDEGRYSFHYLRSGDSPRDLEVGPDAAWPVIREFCRSGERWAGVDWQALSRWELQDVWVQEGPDVRDTPYGTYRVIGIDSEQHLRDELEAMRCGTGHNAYLFGPLRVAFAWFFIGDGEYGVFRWHESIPVAHWARCEPPLVKGEEFLIGSDAPPNYWCEEFSPEYVLPAATVIELVLDFYHDRLPTDRVVWEDIGARFWKDVESLSTDA
jgi:hypothetical protein